MTVSLNHNFFANARALTFEDSVSVTWAFDQNLNQLSATAVVASVANLAGGATGSLPYQSAPGTTAFLAAATNGFLLTLSGGLPSWEAVPTWNQNTSGTAAGLSVTLAIASGGTGHVTAAAAYNALSPMTTTGDIEYESSAGVAARLPVGSSTQVLTVASGVPSWATPILVNGSRGAFLTDASAVTGALWAASAGTRLGVYSSTGTLYAEFGDGTRSTAVGSDASGILGSRTVIGAFSNNSVEIITNNVAALIISNTQTVKMPAALGVNGSAPPAQSTGWGTPVGGAVVANYNITDAGGANSNTNKAVAQILAVLKAVGFLGT